MDKHHDKIPQNSDLKTIQMSIKFKQFQIQTFGKAHFKRDCNITKWNYLAFTFKMSE